MKLEEQCVSLELAKRLKLLNVKQENLFYWYKFLSGEEFQIQNRIDIKNSLVIKEETYSAFTVAELGELLPESIQHTGYWNKIWTAKTQLGGFRVQLGDEFHYEKADKEADAKAKMLIYLLENNLIEED